MITIEVTAYHDKPIAQSIRADFDEKGGTIGRAPESTLVLLDPERKISRTHALLTAGAEGFVLRDQGSLVPVMLNGEPLGNGREAPIRPGDEIRIAGYAMRITSQAATHKAVLSVDVDQAQAKANEAALSVDVDDSQATPKLDLELAPESPVIADSAMPAPVLSWENAEAAGAIEAVTTIILAPTEPAMPPAQPTAAQTAAPGASQPIVEAATPPPSAEPVRDAASAPTAIAAAGREQSKWTDEELLRALLKGAGLPGIDVPGGLTPQLMSRLGQVLREATGGLLDLLAARATTKREVRADMTVIVASDNNPLKFSPDREAALTHLLVPRGRGFMSPLRAVTDAYDDLRAHQLGFMAGMRSALSVVLARFDPRALEARLSDTSMMDSILPTHRKAKLWDHFGQLYGAIATEAEGDFHTLFGREFLRAYQKHVAKPPQHGGSAAHHK